MPLIINKIEKPYQLGVWEINERVEELKKSLNFLKEIPEIKNELRLKQWLAARNILQKISPEANLDIDENGKPHFSQKGLFLSLSHCQNMAAAVVSEKKCGIDLEFYSDKAKKISARFLSEAERNCCKNENDFTHFWMAKEAVYKAFGENKITFSSDIKIDKICFNENDKYLTSGIIEKGETKETYRLYFKKDKNFAYCIAILT